MDNVQGDFFPDTSHRVCVTLGLTILHSLCLGFLKKVGSVASDGES